MGPFPRFQDEFLESLAFAFLKRRKSLSHRASHADFAKVYERMGSETAARLEIDLVNYDDASLRLWARPDRKIWLDARRPAKKGWAWSWTREGRLLGERSASAVIAALEETYDMLYEMDASHASALGGPWTRLLAQGPKAVR
jgi:hypothetical protein